MRTKNYKSLWMGTLVGTLAILITSYLYYNVINDTPVESSGWAYKILYTVIFSFGLSYLLWETSLIGKSHLVTGLVIGLVVSALILVAGRLAYLYSNEEIICCRGNDCWVVVIVVMFATMAMAVTGRTGGGSDDD